MLLDWRYLGLLADMAWENVETVPWVQLHTGSVQDSSYSYRLAKTCQHYVVLFLVSPACQLISQIDTQTYRISWLFNFCSQWWPICVWPCWCTAPALMHFRIDHVDLWHRLVHHTYECVIWRAWMRRKNQLCSWTQCCVPSTCLAQNLYYHVVLSNLPLITRLVVLSGQGHCSCG